MAGCLFEGQGLGWDTEAPGAWGLPLPVDVLESVARQVDVGGLVALAGQRGFLAAPAPLSDRVGDGPVVLVAGGKGFTPWSRDSVEVLRAAGAQVRRLDLLGDARLPADAAGLVLAGSLWPEMIPDIAMNTTLLGDIAVRIKAGLPTLALGGGMLLLLSRLQDTLGRTSELAGVIPAQGEILWDLQDPAYVEVASLRDNLLLAKGEKVMGWVSSEVELSEASQSWEPPLGTSRCGNLEGSPRRVRRRIAVVLSGHDAPWRQVATWQGASSETVKRMRPGRPWGSRMVLCMAPAVRASRGRGVCRQRCEEA